ncbi:hypothetical protein IAE57_14380 [Stenotrophomonas sp. S48]|uniref:hypothetical protein n=1 Tax=unclassified Stenotrophomonas TaxID=196198 RepID=UPI001901BE63|nr:MULTISPECIES: hypothetical protein [unclassified Stenotrophomonas]MBK0027355.1 hypothetical protein [Stenotrophomonas sp. S48]MBK0049733.1 hypothetical protein [Stenotrophomonas sp. S49]
MTSRNLAISWLIALLAACSQAPAPAPKAEAAPAPAPTTTPTAPAPEPSIEDGVDPSVWDNEGEPEGESPSGELTCKDHPLATYFFTLVGGNTVDDCGRKDARLLAAFDALMQDTADAESSEPGIAPLRKRLLSGPSAPGQPLQLQDGVWWFYTACQAHQCPGTALAVLYSPEQGRMVGRLSARCQVRWLGGPNEEQRERIAQLRPLHPAALQGEDADCR